MPDARPAQSTAASAAEPSADSRVRRVAWMALIALFAAGVDQVRRADPDMWHEMALAREAAELGRMPTEDAYAYTPTVTPVVHHEWGTGVIVYAVAKLSGGPGVLILRLALALLIGWTCVRCARRRGANSEVLLFMLPVAVFLAWIGFSPLRAQVFTMLFLAMLLTWLEADRNGRRIWILPWMILYILWLNLHGGFFIGLPLVALHAGEQWLRRRPCAHLFGLLAAMGLSIMLNPYGLAYYPYLWHALFMDRPLIAEWWPIWTAWFPVAMVYGLSLLLIVYAVAHLGWRNLPGLPIVLILGLEAALHTRHAVLYAVAWACYIVPMLSATPLCSVFRKTLYRRATISTAACALGAGVGVFVFVKAQPWVMDVPANPGDDQRLLYPVGALDYLRETGFEGHLMVPFTVGGYVLWKMHPQVLVSLDGRYEVAYTSGVLEEHNRFYDARDGWESVLERFDTHAVLIPRTVRVCQHMPIDGWTRVYRDDAYDLYARSGSALPPKDRSGQRLQGVFP